jgi:hypothetical protein
MLSAFCIRAELIRFECTLRIWGIPFGVISFMGDIIP